MKPEDFMNTQERNEGKIAGCSRCFANRRDLEVVKYENTVSTKCCSEFFRYMRVG